MHVGITGTREGMTGPQKNTVEELLKRLKATSLHHGDCIGSDSDAHGIAECLEISVIVHPPESAESRAYCATKTFRHQKGHFARNRDLVNETSVLIATPLTPFETKGGTWYTINYGIKQRKPVYIVLPNGQLTTRNKPPVLLEPDHYEAGDLPEIKADQVDWHPSLRFVNRTRRYIIPIPLWKDDGEDLVFPCQSCRAGEPIKSYQKQPGKGIVFFNGVDRAWQGAFGNGSDAIVVNEVTFEQAEKLRKCHSKLTGKKDHLSLSDVKSLIGFAREELGLEDFYNKSLSAVESSMAVIDRSIPNYRQAASSKKHRACYIDSGFKFEGPVTQLYPYGGILLQNDNRVWGIDSGVFQRNFKKLIGGNEVDLGRLDLEFR